MHTLLNSINSPDDLKRLAPDSLSQLSGEIRDVMISTVSRNGGHLASSLGAVELSIALHRVFDSPRDKIIWDVGHQSYPHKLLTGRRDRFTTLRMHNGISGFPDPFESSHDPFSGGHAGNSISAAMGMALAGKLGAKDFTSIAVIGDGSIGSGMAFEAMNHAGHMGLKLIIILNDNGMSISPSVGSLSRLLGQIRTAHLPWRDAETAASQGQDAHPCMDTGTPSDENLTRAETILDTLGFTYAGPLDGHNIHELEAALLNIKETMTRPAVVHIITKKGKGYGPAENDAVAFHGISPKKKKSAAPTYSSVFSRTLTRLMNENDRIVAITAAMKEGTGLAEAAQQFPDRVFDTGMSEQHAVTMAGGLATQGFLPIVAIYSTFLQRSYDQIVNDVCLLRLPVVFAIDRAGIVGDDGKTHQGAFDVSYLRSIPNMIVSAPKNENELQHLLYTAVNAGRPMAVRYPRGNGDGVSLQSDFRKIPIGRGELLRKGNDMAIIAFGSAVNPALTAAEILGEMDIECAVVNARFAKPLDEELITGVARRTGRILTVEENATAGGFGSAVAELLSAESIPVKVKCIGIPDRFIGHGTQDLIRAELDLDADGIVRRAKQSFPELLFNVVDHKMENIS
ncbi:MAG TPA: 1-deoxy-D-xylulose-5-phosphate synthase [Spirochaetota bacterium]|nr:1-deoxy-D-xylulose-5-phosphate synthase [Spirochaetota bacterium]HPC39915.1 1-deoxy-D-xylulose-5-phosphate synthase [Spirochaetota bacterium]HPL18036.1 1-deoxy-D-xylulose-5-phosphate synthase [Spirochaetota bacterium]HQF08909.1 1-deoxy-D-xylulose-5-phosphate synthase [Spirochaetota bacterium]HQH97835.1 1-deoxy-D-xylulose-5-phosphate synthase [Spirochaetota bacterium]